jgi:hypothetical protein
MSDGTPDGVPQTLEEAQEQIRQLQAQQRHAGGAGLPLAAHGAGGSLEPPAPDRQEPRRSRDRAAQGDDRPAPAPAVRPA